MTMTSVAVIREVKIKCDCCTTQTMAVQRGGYIIIKTFTHGKWHIVKIDLQSALECGNP